MKKKLSAEIKKVYEVCLGSFYIGTNKEEDFEGGNYTSIKVLAIDVNDALWVAGDWILEQEKEAKKDNTGVYVEEVNLITEIDLIKS